MVINHNLCLLSRQTYLSAYVFAGVRICQRTYLSAYVFRYVCVRISQRTYYSAYVFLSVRIPLSTGLLYSFCEAWSRVTRALIKQWSPSMLTGHNLCLLSQHTYLLAYVFLGVRICGVRICRRTYLSAYVFVGVRISLSILQIP